MAKEITLPEPGAAPGSSLPIGDIMHYLALIEQLISLWNGLRHLKPGDAQEVPDLKIHVGSDKFTWHKSTITKDP